MRKTAMSPSCPSKHKKDHTVTFNMSASSSTDENRVNTDDFLSPEQLRFPSKLVAEKRTLSTITEVR